VFKYNIIRLLTVHSVQAKLKIVV